MIYYELITKKNKSKVHSSPQGLLIGLMYYPAYIGSHDTKLKTKIVSFGHNILAIIVELSSKHFVGALLNYLDKSHKIVWRSWILALLC